MKGCCCFQLVSWKRYLSDSAAAISRLVRQLGDCSIVIGEYGGNFRGKWRVFSAIVNGVIKRGNVEIGTPQSL